MWGAATVLMLRLMCVLTPPNGEFLGDVSDLYFQAPLFLYHNTLELLEFFENFLIQLINSLHAFLIFLSIFELS